MIFAIDKINPGIFLKSLLTNLFKDFINKIDSRYIFKFFIKSDKFIKEKYN